AEPNEHGKIVWECVDVVAARKLPRPVTLEAVKAEPRLANMALVKLSRLSVSPVSDEEWKIVCEMGGLPA
ncbi:MAG TPA: EVE domain-containing protein, partial [Devosiaceae bacterium]|nr:EVE domain-containing protein [Devosiaceae bacterium]